jgi:hypothetical protein
VGARWAEPDPTLLVNVIWGKSAAAGNDAGSFFKFRFITTASMIIPTLRERAPCSLAEVDRRFRSTVSILGDWKQYTPLKRRSTATSLYTWRYIQEGCHFQALFYIILILT